MVQAGKPNDGTETDSGLGTEKLYNTDKPGPLYLTCIPLPQLHHFVGVFMLFDVISPGYLIFGVKNPFPLGGVI